MECRMNPDPDFDPMLDCYLSWEAFIAWLRQRLLAGEAIGPGPWQPKPKDKNDGCNAATKSA